MQGRPLRRMLPLCAAIVLMTGACQPAEPTAAPEQPGTTPMVTEAAAGECQDELGCVEVAAGDPIKLGAIFVLSGANESLGTDSLHGVEIAVDDMKEVKGHPVEVSSEDGGCTAEGGQAAAQKVAADTTIAGVIGTSCSSEATGAIPIITAAGLTMISPSNTAPALTAKDRDATYAGYLRTAHNDKFQGRVAAEYAFNDLKATKAATIHDGSPYAEQLQQVFADSFKALGGEIVSQQAVNVGDTDMRPVLNTIAAGAPQLIYYPIFVAEGGFITSQAKEIDALADTTLMGADGLFSPDFVKAAGEAAGGMYLTGPSVSGAEYDAFIEKHKAKYGGVPPSGFHAHAYDATRIMLQAIDSVAVEGSDGSLYIPKQALRDAIYATSGFKGLTGTLSCQGMDSDSPGDCATGEALAVFQITPEVAADPDATWPPPVVWPKQ